MIPTTEIIMLLMMLVSLCLIIATFVFFIIIYTMHRELLNKLAFIENDITEKNLGLVS